MKKTKVTSQIKEISVQGMGRTIPKPNITTGSHKPKTVEPKKK